MCSVSSSLEGDGLAHLDEGRGIPWLASCTFRDPSWQIAAVDHWRGREDDGSLDRVAQLAEVAGPGVLEQGLPGVFGEPVDFLAELARQEREQVLGQREQVGSPAEWRHRELRRR